MNMIGGMKASAGINQNIGRNFLNNCGLDYNSADYKPRSDEERDAMEALKAGGLGRVAERTIKLSLDAYRKAVDEMDRALEAKELAVGRHTRTLDDLAETIALVAGKKPGEA